MCLGRTFEPSYFSLNPVIFHRTILYFLVGYSNSALSRECRTSSITQKKPAIQMILNTPIGQIPCVAGFSYIQYKSVDRSTVSMLRSIFDELGLFYRHSVAIRPRGMQGEFKPGKEPAISVDLCDRICGLYFRLMPWYYSNWLGLLGYFWLLRSVLIHVR